MGSFFNKGDVLNRIKERYSLKNNADLARFLGVAPNTITNWYNRGTFDIDLIYTKCEGIDFNWLFKGGSIIPSENAKANNAPLISLVSNYEDLTRIPIVDISVAAGSGYINSDYIEEVECISMPSTMIKDGKQYLCVRVKGQSMVPSIMDGGYLIIRLLDRSEWESIRDNYVYVVSDTEGKAYVKRLKNRLRQHGFIVCMSDNVEKQHYPNFNLYQEELNTIWYAEWYFSAKIPNIQETYYHKQAELEDRIDELALQYQQLSKAINIHNS
ncbi:LexA family transcriptional regulator [Parabacteroides chinchillae]|uniref:Peptidase S24-like n=1 Tax=Parabacteroides chinchillae TaxID=871327 RepID=A0A8G2BWF4_9BACT|nr:S24 family peptidase [Parabacteroides chinchillae]SEF87019.1 Peptidase S24-like [Parabacteroides chinchillae]